MSKELKELLEESPVAASSEELMKDILEHLSGLNRNLVSDEFEESLCYLGNYIPLKVHRYKTGTPCWTWEIPPKWRIRDGYIRQGGRDIVSFRDHSLHVMSYSTPVRLELKGSELLEHVHVHSVLPEAIPYEFSFYKRRWGFCLTHAQRDLIRKDETYEVCIDSEFVDDYLSVGEYTVPGTSDEHIYFLCHIDHPTQVNDGIMGAAVNIALAKQLENRKGYYNYTFLFVPETIGSIAYLSHNEHLLPKIRYAVFVEMVGLGNPLVLQRSRKEDALVNAYVLHVLRKRQGQSKGYPFLSVAANDEKIFDGPGVGIPSISITRVDQEKRLQKKQGDGSKEDHMELPYPQYHSHLDNLDLVNCQNVREALGCLQDLVDVIEEDFIPVRKFKGPVFLSKYDLWIDWRTNPGANKKMVQVMYAMEGNLTAFQIAQRLGMDFEETLRILNQFHKEGLLEKRRIHVGFDR